MECVISCKEEPIDSDVNRFLLENAVSDGGQWNMLVSLVKKYGIMQAPTLVMIDGDSYEKFSGVSDIRGWLNKKHS